ncbi:MAG: 4-alpha-glucanotransferase, partial [Neisseria elongata]
IRSRGSWGTGDTDDLTELASFLGDQGADFLLINPLHAAEPVAPMTPSPYLPVTRRFVNPLYIRPENIPEVARLSGPKRSLVQWAFEEVKDSDLSAEPIDRDTVWKAKHEALEVIFSAGRSYARQRDFERFRAEQGEGLERFALWSALVEKHGSLDTWPATLRDAGIVADETAAKVGNIGGEAQKAAQAVVNDAAKNGAGEAKTAYDRLAASIKNAASAADLQRAAAQAKEAFKNGIITAAQYDQAVAQAKVRTDELAAAAAAVGQQAETGYAQASQAAERYGQTVRQAADGHKEVGHAAQASAQTAGGAWGKMTVNVHDYLSMTREQIRAMGDAMKTLTPLGSIGTAGINGGFKEWAARVKTFKDGVREAEAATEALNRAVSDGTVNMEMINRATVAATLQFGRLDDATLDKLNAAVAAARDKMAALKDEAADTVAQLQTELARLRGDGEQARRLEEERKLRELNVKLAEAEAQGNSEAAARYRQAVSLQRQIYRERAEQEEQAEKVRAEKPQADLAAAFETALPQIGIPLSDLQRLIEARDKRVAEAAAESVIAGLEAAFRRTV